MRKVKEWEKCKGIKGDGQDTIENTSQVYIYLLFKTI